MKQLQEVSYSLHVTVTGTCTCTHQYSFRWWHVFTKFYMEYMQKIIYKYNNILCYFSLYYAIDWQWFKIKCQIMLMDFNCTVVHRLNICMLVHVGYFKNDIKFTIMQLDDKISQWKQIYQLLSCDVAKHRFCKHNFLCSCQWYLCSDQ